MSDESNTTAQSRRVRPYDFRRPPKIGRDHSRTMQIVFETFARQVATQMSSRLRAAVSIAFDGVSQSTFDEWIQRIPNPCYMAIFEPAPLPGLAAVSVPLDLAIAIHEMSLGGQPSGEPSDRSSLTDIEATVVKDVFAAMLDELTYAFDQVPVSIRPKFVQAEFNPQFAQIASPADTVIPVDLEVSIDSVQARMSVCFPYTTLAEVLERVTRSAGRSANAGLPNDTALLVERVSDAELVVSLRTAPLHMASQRVCDLEVGDVLGLRHHTSHAMQLTAGDVCVALAKPITEDRRRHAQIELTLGTQETTR